MISNYYKECPRCREKLNEKWPMSSHIYKGKITYICSNRDCTYTKTHKLEEEDK